MTNDFNIALAENKKPYWVWGPLAFSLFYFLPLFFNFSYFWPTKFVLVVLIYGLFVTCYSIACNAPGEKAFIPVFSIILLATFGTFITPGTQALFGFAAYFLGFNFSLNKGFGWLCFSLSCLFSTAYVNNFIDVYFLAPAIIVSIGLFFLGLAERKDRIYRTKEEKSQQQIEQLATIAERERIARDLHDLVGHSLSSIALNADLAQKLINANKVDDAKHYINEVANLSRGTLSEVRHAVSGLKQINIDSQIAKLTKELSNQHFAVEVTNKLGKLPPKVESNLLLMLTELVTNILRHSQGDRVVINLNMNGSVKLSVFDNGHCDSKPLGNGLNGIKERCQEIGAEMLIDQSDGFLVQIKFTESS